MLVSVTEFYNQLYTYLDSLDTMASSLLRLLSKDDERSAVLRAYLCQLHAHIQIMTAFTSSVAYIACGSAIVDTHRTRL